MKCACVLDGTLKLITTELSKIPASLNDYTTMPSHEKFDTNVIYVQKRHAKLVKNSLERHGLLDKFYRLTQVDPTAFHGRGYIAVTSSTGSHTETNDSNNENTATQDDDSKYIAIPIIEESFSSFVQTCHQETSKNQGEFLPLISGIGKQPCLYSSSILGNHAKTKTLLITSKLTSNRNGRSSNGTNQNTNNDKNNNTHNIVERILIEAILNYSISQNQGSADATSGDNDYETKVESKRKVIERQIIHDKILLSTTCPNKLETMGDHSTKDDSKNTIVLPYKALNIDIDYQLKQLIDQQLLSASEQSCYDEENNNPIEAKREEFHTFLWSKIGQMFNCTRVVRRGEIDPNSRIRHSGHTILWVAKKINDNENSNEDDDALKSGPGSIGWITITEQGIKQSFDLTKVMFSRGNISEKIRFGKLVKKNDLVLDMYAGIGYYTLPALIYGKAKHVYACEWNPDAILALKYNIIQNGVDDRVTVLEGDSRATIMNEDILRDGVGFDRVSLGLLPSSEGGWKTAVSVLNKKRGGWLHIHGNVPVTEKQQWCLWACQQLSKIYLDVQKCDDQCVDHVLVICYHLERVKSFAPKVDHLVADIFVGKDLPSEFDSVKSEINASNTNCKVGIICQNGTFCPCPEEIEAPSCALNAGGVLSQEWMM